MYGERRGTYKVLVGKPEGRRQLERPRNRWEDNIKMDIGEVGWGHGLDRSRSEQGQVTCCCEYGNELSGFIRGGEFL